MKFSTHILAFSITLLTSAQGADVGISGADVLSIDEPLGFCPPDMNWALNKILGVATDTLNVAWQAYGYDSLENVYNVTYTVDDIDLTLLDVTCLGTAEKIDIEANIKKVTGLENLHIDDLTLESSAAGKGRSCSDDPDSGPFRCVYEGTMDGGVSLLSPLEVQVDMKATIHCKPLWGKPNTKDIDPGAISCDLSEEISGLGGGYCAGHCLNNFVPVMNDVTFDELRVDISSLDCSCENILFNAILSGIIGPIKENVATAINAQIVTAVDKATEGVFPYPTKCPRRYFRLSES